jgi:hypothetical protein
MPPKSLAAESSITIPQSLAGKPVFPEVTDQRFKLYKSTEGYRAIMSWYDDVLEMIDVDVESQYVNTRFGNTHMLTCGPKDGEPLFLIPGIAGCAPLWRAQLPDFAKKFRVYALDIVGQPGRSAPNPPSFLNDDYVDWLTDIVDNLGIDKVEISIDGDILASINSPPYAVPWRITSGKHIIRGTAYDHAGNKTDTRVQIIVE